MNPKELGGGIAALPAGSPCNAVLIRIQEDLHVRVVDTEDSPSRGTLCVVVEAGNETLCSLAVPFYRGERAHFPYWD